MLLTDRMQLQMQLLLLGKKIGDDAIPGAVNLVLMITNSKMPRENCFLFFRLWWVDTFKMCLDSSRTVSGQFKMYFMPQETLERILYCRVRWGSYILFWYVARDDYALSWYVVTDICAFFIRKILFFCASPWTLGFLNLMLYGFLVEIQLGQSHEPLGMFHFFTNNCWRQLELVRNGGLNTLFRRTSWSLFHPV